MNKLARYAVVVCSAAILTSAAFTASAQNFVKFNLLEEELVRFNPASAPEDGSRFYGNYKYTWSKSPGYGENPHDVAAGFCLNFKWGAISADVDYDGYSFFKRHEFKLNYSYMWRLKNARHSRLSAGGGLSFGIDDIDFESLHYPRMLMGRGLYCSPDINLGFEYSDDHIRTGIGMTNLLSTSQKFAPTGDDDIPPKTDPSGEALVRNPRVIMSYFMYRFDLYGFGLTPMIYAGYSERTEVSIGLRADWKKDYSFTYSFRGMEMAHICTLFFRIPRTLIRVSVAYSNCAFYKDQSLSAGISVRW